MYKNLNKYLLLLFLFLYLGFSSQSQTNLSYYYDETKINPADSGKFFLQIDNVNFIKNNEYFGPVVKGYTLLGIDLKPTLVYFPSKRIKLYVGADLISYDGRNNELDASMLLSFQYKVSPKFDFILGNIYGTINHRLIEPLYDFERFLNKTDEKGVQFLWNSKRIFADLWLNWEQQIFQDDPFQEKFNVGLSADFTLFEKENKYKVSIPFQNLIRHQGGQINSNSEEPLTTIYNNAIGLSITKPFSWKYLHQMNFTSYWLNYQDLSPDKRQMYIDGMASYTTLEFENNSFNFLLGYWYGSQFIAPSGNPIFETYSRTEFYVEQPVREIITSKLLYQKNVFKGINLGLRLESYYDMINGNFEYSWSFIVVLKEKFFLKDI